MRQTSRVRFVILSFICLGGFFRLWSHQTSSITGVYLSSTVTSEITVCGESETYGVEILNAGSDTLTNIEVEVILPTGITYVASSGHDASGHGWAEQNVSDLSAPIFSLGDLIPGQTAILELEASASMAARQAILDGEVLRNTIQLHCDQGTETEVSNSYNALFAALSIINISPSSETLITGENSSRTITIVNGGNGKINSFYLTDIHNAALSLDSISIGTLNATKDTLFFSDADVSGIGNGDNFFDTNESFSVTEYYQATGCTDQTVISTFKAGWGCEGTETVTAPSYGSVGISRKTPSIAVSIDNDPLLCMGNSEAVGHSMTFTNNGQGLATGLELSIYKSSGSGYDQTIFSRLDEGSFTYQLGSGTASPLTPASADATNHSGAYACLGTNPVGRVGFTLPDLESGESFTITWDSYHCCINACLGELNTGWRYELDYEDYCQQSTYNKDGTGYGQETGIMTLFEETPTNILDGETETFAYTISSYSNEFQAGEGARLVYNWDIPVGLVWSGNSDDLVWASDATEWEPHSISYHAGTRVLTAAYELPAAFTIPKTQIRLRLTADCGEAGASTGNMDLGLQINYLPDTTCNSICEIVMACSQTTSLDLFCPDPCTDGGIQVEGFNLTRTNFGEPDNDQNGLADNAGSLDFSRVKVKRAMVGDTLRGTFSGTVATTLSHPSWAYGYASSTIDRGAYLTESSALLRVYDASAGTYLICDQVEISSAMDGSQRVFAYDFSPATLSAACSDFSSWAFENGDSIWLETEFYISSNPGAIVEQVEVNNSIYLSNVVNPLPDDRYACGYRDETFTMIGYTYEVLSRDYYTVNNCTKDIKQRIRLGIGDCCSNFDGGNLFPFEYRDYGYPTEVYAVLPANYAPVDYQFKQWRTRGTNSTATTTINSITPSQVNGDTLWFDLAALYNINGGTVAVSDEGFTAEMIVEVAPSCEVPTNTYQDMYWGYQFQTLDEIAAPETDWLPLSPDRVRFRPSSLVLSSPDPIEDGLERTVSWEVQVKNTSNYGSNNAWLHLKNFDGNIEILSVIDLSADTLMSVVGDVYHLGTINKNKSKTYLVTGNYSSCGTSSFTAYAGYECSGYPNTFADFSCPYTELDLYVAPKESEMQIRLSGESIGSACSDTVQITVEIASVKLGAQDSIEVTLSTLDTLAIQFIDGSGELKHPLDQDFVSITDPVQSGQSWLWDLESVSELLAARGLPGIAKLDSNRLQLRFNILTGTNFAPGDYFEMQFDSYEPCGVRENPQVFQYDPSIKFEIPVASGLTSDAGSSWGASWGDFDGDGWEDLFVPEYGVDKGSFLYQNQGDGTFSKVTDDPVVSALGSATAGAWGDYDNDGDLDLIVANNIQAVNHLYQNQGDGSFELVDAGSISNYNGYCHSVSWVDVDNDGWLDVFFTDFFRTRFNQLYLNNQDGTFTQASGSALNLEASSSIGAVWADVDLDGDMDVFIPNNHGENNSMYRNEGGTFVAITTGAIVNDGGNSVGASWGDYDNDGDFDLYVVNASLQPNFFYENQGDWTFDKLSIDGLTTALDNSHGCDWMDLNNDGFLDLYVANDQSEENRLYMSGGDGTFWEMELDFLEETENSLAVISNDLDEDGDLDIFVANHSSEVNSLYKNSRGACASWVSVCLSGTSSNYTGIGTRVAVKSALGWQTRFIDGGGRVQSGAKAHFGLGEDPLIDSLIVYWPSGIEQVLTNQPINQEICITEHAGTLLTGLVYFDEDEDCVWDSLTETVLPNVMIEIQPGPRYVLTDSSGRFSTYLNDGNYGLEVQVEGDWSATCSDSSSVTIGTGQNPPEQRFGLTTPCIGPDLVVGGSGSAMRKGASHIYTLTYQNDGFGTAAGTQLDLRFPPEIIPLSFSQNYDYSVSDTAGTVYTWLIGNMDPRSAFSVQIVDSISNDTEIGAELSYETTISSSTPDCDSTNNSYREIGTVEGSIDPNDILVFPEGAITTSDTLIYRIRFQNVGTSEAQLVTVHDTLPAELDLSTFKLLSTSHPATLDISEEGSMRWTFRNIQLPDSSTDEANSHGFIQFRIRPKKGLSIGTEIHNRAAIVFDRNEAIITNTVVNVIADALQLAKEGRLEVKAFPNPMSTEGKIVLQDKANPDIKVEIHSVRLLSPNGGVVWQADELNQRTIPIPRANLSSGFYLVEATDAFGFRYRAKLIIK